MEILESKFYEALLEYFAIYRKKHVRDTTWKDADMIVKGLQNLLDIYTNPNWKVGEKLASKKTVHIGSIFGPFGFKIK